MKRPDSEGIRATRGAAHCAGRARVGEMQAGRQGLQRIHLDLGTIWGVTEQLVTAPTRPGEACAGGR